MSRGHTSEEVQAAVSASLNLADTLRHLDLVPVGGNYKTLKQNIHKYGISTAHFRRKKTGGGPRKFRPLADILKSDSPFSTSHLRRRLISEGILEDVCSACGLSEWRGSSITLHLDHIDGITSNNTLSNLRLLCPNCHSQTSTYCGRNKQRIIREYSCMDCGKPKKTEDSLRCRSCAGRRRIPPCSGEAG